jgi:ABC-2 type transport system ATP-binding protein
VQSLCRRVAIIDHGQMLAFDSIENLLSGLSADLHLSVSGGKLNGQLADLARVETGTDGRPTVVIPGDQPNRGEILQTVLSRLQAAGISVDKIETQQSNLERLFLQLTGRKLRD